MRLTILLFCCAVMFGQTTSAPDPSLEQGRPGDNVEVLSDTEGVDFAPYLKSILTAVRGNWHRLIPESAQRERGNVAIEFAIAKDGGLSGMHLVKSSGDASLDRAAWGGITGSSPFPPLPTSFKGPYLALRLHFSYNPNRSDMPDAGQTVAPSPAQKRVEVSISPIGGRVVPVGGSLVVVATVTGTDENAVAWKISGSGCTDSACGRMAQNSGLYLAPIALPNPPFVMLQAISKADPSAKASVTLRIVPPSSPR